jgi:hypothetical protein
MMRGMASVAECNEVRRFVHATTGTGDQVMHVGFTLRTGLAAGPAGVVVASEHDGPHLAPLLKLLLAFGERHGSLLEDSGRAGRDERASSKYGSPTRGVPWDPHQHHGNHA